MQARDGDARVDDRGVSAPAAQDVELLECPMGRLMVSGCEANRSRVARARSARPGSLDSIDLQTFAPCVGCPGIRRVGRPVTVRVDGSDVTDDSTVPTGAMALNAFSIGCRGGKSTNHSTFNMGGAVIGKASEIASQRATIEAEMASMSGA